ncbi:hypothetical protein [Paraglaciecola sp. L3A3]|uniref:hypothetical protein n=1 Tax=Paraglaciecola sp. L3A3 TaxID=2686358 RepID=UPI00131BC613|nr:hypothetical protein [Paraglaciecola sp. L3A3]
MKQRLFVPNIIDIEASGFGAFSYPIEVGVVNTQGQKFCRLVKPVIGWEHWDVKAESLHGISRELLQAKGESVVQLCLDLNVFLKNQVVYSDGWVVDQPWLIKLFDGAKIPMKFTISPLEMILNEQQMSVWHVTKDKVCENMNIRRHRASSDAALIQSTFVTTQKMSFSQSTHT